MSDENKKNNPFVNTIYASLVEEMTKERPDKISLMDSVEKTYESIETSINDSYGNSLLEIGTDDKISQFDKYGFSNSTLNYLLWLALYNDSWVFRRAIDKPAQDEVRCTLTLGGDQNKSNVYKLLKNARFSLINLLQWGALFGGSVAVMMFDSIDNDDEYSKPMNKSKIKKAKVIKYYVTDRWYGCQASDETVDKMNSDDFGKPKYYEITFADGHSMKVHHDYVLRYEHRTAPQLIKTGQLQGWGYAEGSHILIELSRDDKLRSSIQSLVDKSLIEVIKMAGMRGVFMGQDTESNAQLQQRLEMVTWARNFNSLTFLDSDDEYHMNEFSGLTGLSDLVEREQWLISAALEMQGVLFGDMKTGFANDTEAMERYDETIRGRCESYVRPVYNKLLKVFYLMSGVTDPVEFEFNSLLEDRQKEIKIDRLSKFSDLGIKLMDAGILDVKLLATAFNNYAKNDIIDFGLTDEKIDELEESFDEQNEAFDIGSESIEEEE